MAEMPLEKESLVTRISASVHVLHIDQVLCDASSYYPNSCFILIYTAKCGNRTHLTQVFFAIVFLSFLAPALALSCVSWLSSLSGPCFLLKVLCLSRSLVPLVAACRLPLAVLPCFSLFLCRLWTAYRLVLRSSLRRCLLRRFCFCCAAALLTTCGGHDHAAVV